MVEAGNTTEKKLKAFEKKMNKRMAELEQKRKPQKRAGSVGSDG